MSNSKNFSLIVPAASDKGIEAGAMPRIFSTGRDGVLMCVKSMLGLNLDAFDNIYFTILRKHAEAFDIDSLLRLQFRRLGLDNVRIVILDEPTATQAETIVRTIEKENITGAIFVKDADCFFRAEVYPENGVAVYPLEQLELVDPRHKSYVAVDDMQHVTNIIEKRVVSHLFNAGGYCFEDVATFLKAYDRYASLGPVYLSHLIYAMLLDGDLFRPMQVKEYNDWNIQ